MPHRRPAVHRACRVIAATACLALVAGGCGQVTPGEQSTTTSDSGATAATTAGGTTSAPAPTPGSGATPGCEVLVEPVHRLVTDQVDSEVGSEEVRRLAAGVEDNALSAVASRISGLVVQPAVDPSAVDEQWGQFARLCDLD
ncbi:MAG: hypothetical protein ACK4UY_12830 [Dietzia sp.]